VGFVVDEVALGGVLSESFLSRSFQQCSILIISSPNQLLDNLKEKGVGFGGLEVACWLRVPKFAVSNPAEPVGFFRPKKKSSASLPSEGK
jgi:hypothetical protein